MKRALYYDNPERFFAGGYSASIEKMVPLVDCVFFANKSLIKKGIANEGGGIDLSEKEVMGIGHYPTGEAEQISRLRKDGARIAHIRATFFKRHGILDKGQRILLYLGGANEIYYEKAFPHFVQMVTPLLDETTLLVLQQHPRAKRDGNKDLQYMQETLKQHAASKTLKFIALDISTAEGVALSERVLYYQTSMGAQFAFAGIPAIQVGDERYEDLLVRGGSLAVTKKEELAQVLLEKAVSVDPFLVRQELGIDPHWEKNLLQIDKSDFCP